jgi:hypothetical protein
MIPAAPRFGNTYILMTRTIRLSLVSLAATLAVAACADTAPSPLAPDAAAPQPAAPSALLGGLLGGSAQQVVGTEWQTPLAQNLTATASIGALGGVIELPATGLRVIVPPGAVLRQTQFGVTALAGKIVAYDFQPAGTRFIVPLIVTQSAAKVRTTAPSSLLTVLRPGYFQSATDLDQSSGTVRVAELLPPISLNLLGNLTFTVSHFSGYIVCWGRSDD